MAATGDNGGYWLVATDGGIFPYGDAGFFGSAESLPLNKPVVGMAATTDAAAYWLVASDGGIFDYGDAPSSAPGPAGPQQADRRHGGDSRQSRLLAGRVRRRDLRLRRRGRSSAPPDPSPSTSRSSAWHRRPTAAGTGWWPPMGASSATATRRSTARPGTSPSTSPSSPWRRCPTAAATGSPRPTAVSSTTARHRSSAARHLGLGTVVAMAHDGAPTVQALPTCPPSAPTWPDPGHRCDRRSPPGPASPATSLIASAQNDLVVVHVDGDRRALEVLALEQRQRQRVLDLALQHPAQRAGPVVGVVPGVGQPLLGLGQ